MESQSLILTPFAGVVPLEADAKTTELISFLRKAPLFAGVSTNDLIRISGTSQRCSVAKGARLYNRDEPVRKVVLIYSGTVKLTYSNMHGSEIILALRSAGEIVDLPTGMAPHIHKTGAEAVTICRVLRWKAADFDAIVQQTRELNANISHILSGQLDNMEQRFFEVACEKVGRRVASTLIRLAKQIGTSSQQGFVVPVSRQDLAQLTGTNLFSVSRLISRWVECGLVLPSRREIVIPSLEALDRATSATDEVGDLSCCGLGAKPGRE